MRYYNIEYNFNENLECFVIKFEDKEVKRDSIKECKKEIDKYFESRTNEVINYIFDRSKHLSLGEYSILFLDKQVVGSFVKLHIKNVYDIGIITAPNGVGGTVKVKVLDYEVFNSFSNWSLVRKVKDLNISVIDYFSDTCIVVKIPNDKINELKESIEKRNNKIDKTIEEINQINSELETQVNKFFDLNSIADIELYNHVKGNK